MKRFSPYRKIHPTPEFHFRQTLPEAKCILAEGVLQGYAKLRLCSPSGRDLTFIHRSRKLVSTYLRS
ncbi:hypothetical protein TNCV_4513101 [Trichonephila clavipes]|nr:hypothetical protein TNCV_4513101 [Trichonephila clavipes]